MSTSLLAQQRDLARAITSGLNPAVGLLRGAAATERLQIYVNAWQIRLVQALQDNYPVLALVLGDAGFDDLARQYLDYHPSSHWSIRWFGDQLEAFVRNTPELLPHPALTDLIRMEWALGTAFDASDAPVENALAMQALAAQDWPVLRFVPHPSVQLLALDWQVEPLWKKLSHDPDAQTEVPLQRSHHLLVWRQDLINQWRVVGETEAQALSALLAGATFAEICTAAANAPDSQSEPAATVAGLLRGWLDAGLISQFYPLPTNPAISLSSSPR